MNGSMRWSVPFAAVLVFLLGSFVSAGKIYLPFVSKPEPTPVPLQEVRAIWISRFDWTSNRSPALPAKIEEMVNDVAFAGFNTIYFQVRGTGDAYYASELEPWAQRVSGDQLGKAPDPYWDPLGYMIEKAHEVGIEVHAYLNVYPLWDCGAALPSADLPHIYNKLGEVYGFTNGYHNGLQKPINSTDPCIGGYRRASPASFTHDNHLANVVRDIAAHYDVDGIHLDHIRYGSSQASCDPTSLCRYHNQGEFCSPVPTCAITDDYADWQRRQVNGTVYKIYDLLSADYPDLILSAAVWPMHKKKWADWPNAQEGFYDYYQDSKAWMSGRYIDSISPMIYSNSDPCNNGNNSYWTRDVWRTLVADFQQERYGRWVIPGIGGRFCDFAEIAWRIEQAREIGTAGHAIFSYTYLKELAYFDDLRTGPYSRPATIPQPDWK